MKKSLSRQFIALLLIPVCIMRDPHAAQRRYSGSGARARDSAGG